MTGLDLNCLPEFLWAGYKVFLPGEVHVTRICNEDVLLIVVKGNLNFTEAGRQITLTRGDYYIQRSGLFQQGVKPSDAEYYYLHFHGSFDHRQDCLPLYGKTSVERFEGPFSSLLGYPDPQVTKTELSAAFYTVLSLLKSGAEQTDGRKLVSRVVSTVSADLTRKYSLDELAADSGYSKNHFINIFKAQTGKTPYEYILDMRMQRVTQLLYDTDMPVGKISEATGFGSYVNLYKEFVKKEGCPPLEWRKKRRNLS